MGLGLSKRNLALVLALACLFSGGVEPLTALAKKKAKSQEAAAPAVDPVAEAEARLSKELVPLDAQLTKLLMKVQGRYLLSPEEAGQLVEIKYKLLDLLSQNPKSPQLGKPLYQAGILFTQREEYNDAYEMFNYLAQGFSNSQYGIKAKGHMLQMEKRFGPDYFAVEASVTSSALAPATPAAASPASQPAAATPAAPAKPPAKT